MKQVVDIKDVVGQLDPLIFKAACAMADEYTERKVKLDYGFWNEPSSTLQWIIWDEGMKIATAPYGTQQQRVIKEVNALLAQGYELQPGGTSHKQTLIKYTEVA